MQNDLIFVADSHSTDKRLCIEESGSDIYGHRRKSLVILQGIPVEDDTHDVGTVEIARFSLNKERAKKLIEALQLDWD